MKLHRNLANNYFNHLNLEFAQSGLLTQIVRIKNIAEQCGIDFEHLLGLIAENNFTQFPTGEGNYVVDFFDCIDDSILALNLAYKSFDIENSDWIDDHFRESLAFIQAKNEKDNVIKILKARSTTVKRLAGKPERWKSYVSSGIPLMSIAKIDELMNEILSISMTYLDSEKQIEDKITFLRGIEGFIEKLPSSHFRHDFLQQDIDAVRLAWLKGDSLKGIENGDKIANDYLGFTIPWVLNAISKKFYLQRNEEVANLFEEFGVLCELGLPSFWAAKIYLSGIRSRQTAKEISFIIKEEFGVDSLSEISDFILKNKDVLKRQKDCSEHTLRWVELFSKEKHPLKKSLSRIPNFIFADKDLDIKSTILYCKSFGDICYLCSSDYKDKIKITVNEEFPFNEIQDIPGVYFEWENDTWKMKNKNLNFQIQEN